MVYAHQQHHAFQVADPTGENTIYVHPHGRLNRKENLIYEIEKLRREMVEKVLEGQSFTSQQVVAISQTLDQKLNEFMLVSK